MTKVTLLMMFISCLRTYLYLRGGFFATPTKDNLVICEILQPNLNMCLDGCSSEKNVDHLFLGCNVFGILRSLI